DESTKTKLSRQAYTRKNKKLRHEQKQTKMLHSPNDDILPVIDDIIFDPSRHRIQSATRKLFAIDNIYYLKREWRSVPLCPSDRISSKKIRTQHNISAKDLLIEMLLREASTSNNSIDLPKISPDFLSLVYSDIIKEKNGCITNLGHRTLIHLEQLDDPDAVTTASNIINWYYFHLLENPSYRSKEFWTNFIEHFGTYTRNNLLPFTSSNTASTHNINHHECVNKLLRGLRKLSKSINRFLQEYYVDLYTKLSKLSWGPFAPRAFRVFSMIAINFNTIRDFEEGELYFPQLQVVVHLRSGQVVDFDSTYLEARIEKANGPIVFEQNLNNA
ncbi:914_t:CDS:2, partial [Racocetra persica]